MNRVRPHGSRVLGLAFAAALQIATGALLLSVPAPAAGTGPWYLTRVFCGAFLLFGSFLAATAGRLVRSIEFDDVLLRHGRRSFLWRDIGAIRLIRLGSTLDFRCRSGKRLLTLSVGSWPLSGVKALVDVGISKLPLHPLPWKDAEGAALVEVDENGLTVNHGLRVEQVTWQNMMAVELAKSAEPGSYAVLRVRVTKRDGTVLYPGLSRTDEVVLYQVLSRHAQRIAR